MSNPVSDTVEDLRTKILNAMELAEVLERQGLHLRHMDLCHAGKFTADQLHEALETLRFYLGEVKDE